MELKFQTTPKGNNPFVRFHEMEQERFLRMARENVVYNPQWPSLQAWSWQDIQEVYKIYGGLLDEYKDIADRFEFDLPLKVKPGETIQYSNGNEAFVQNFYAGVTQINQQLKVLDDEIARRNKLIGIMG